MNFSSKTASGKFAESLAARHGNWKPSWNSESSSRCADRHLQFEKWKEKRLRLNKRPRNTRIQKQQAQLELFLKRFADSQCRSRGSDIPAIYMLLSMSVHVQFFDAGIALDSTRTGSKCHCFISHMYNSFWKYAQRRISCLTGDACSRKKTLNLQRRGSQTWKCPSWVQCSKMQDARCALLLHVF